MDAFPRLNTGPGRWRSIPVFPRSARDIRKLEGDYRQAYDPKNR
jgi:hypothetical protein